MSKLFITYKLKPGITHEQFETWVRTIDYPAMRGMARISSFVTHRAVRHLLDQAAPSMAYIEEFHIPDLEGFMREDFPSAGVQKILGEFMGFVDSPEFIVTEDVV